MAAVTSFAIFSLGTATAAMHIWGSRCGHGHQWISIERWNGLNNNPSYYMRSQHFAATCCMSEKTFTTSKLVANATKTT